jgi:flagellar hook-length control protein FliK
MLKQVVPESMQKDFQTSTKILFGIFRLADNSSKINLKQEGLADGKEDWLFLPLLKEGLTALNIKGAKTPAANGIGSILNNTWESIPGGVLQIDERQLDFTEIPAGLQSMNFIKTDNSVVQDRSVDVTHKVSCENNAVGLQSHTTQIGTQGGVLKSNKTEAEKGAPFSPDKEQMKDIDNTVNDALREKGIDEQDSGDGMLQGTPSDSGKGKVAMPESLLAALLEKSLGEQDSGEGMLKGTPSDSGNGKVAMPESLLAALREKGIDEKDISKVMAVTKERELKSVPLERQVGEGTVERDSGVGMLKVIPSDSNAKMGDSRSGTPSFLGKSKVTVQEPFTLVEQAGLTSYGSDSKVIGSGGVKPIESRLLIDQIASQLHPEADKGFSRVRIALFPENLGSLDIDIIIRENKIRLVLMADRPDVRQVLQGHADQLRNALQSRGLQVDGIDFLFPPGFQEMDGGSGGSHLSWREDNGSAKGGKKEGDVPASSAIPLLVSRTNRGTMEGGISLFV